MADRRGRTTSLVDVLDRVLEKGIVIDASVRISLAGIELMGMDVTITVASFETYLQLADDPRAYELGLLSGPRLHGEQREAIAGTIPSGVFPPPAAAGGTPAEGPEKLGRAAFHEEEPVAETVDEPESLEGS